MKLHTNALALIAGAMTTLGLVACGGAHALSDAEQTNAELGARSYAERVEGSFVSCSGQDSDRDGYVSCDVTGASGPIAIACAYETRGCKTKAAVVVPLPDPHTPGGTLAGHGLPDIASLPAPAERPAASTAKRERLAPIYRTGALARSPEPRTRTPRSDAPHLTGPDDPGL